MSRRPQAACSSFERLLSHPHDKPLLHVDRSETPTAFPNPWLAEYRRQLLAQNDGGGGGAERAAERAAEREELKKQLTALKEELKETKAASRARLIDLESARDGFEERISQLEEIIADVVSVLRQELQELDG